MERPRFLYRYRSMADDTLRERVRQILVEHLTYLAPASSFNDPFDCCPLVDDRASVGEYLAHFMRLPWLNREQALQRTAEFSTRTPSIQRSVNAAKEALQAGLLTKFGILCLNTDPLHELMWAHYADSHRGVCIQFDAQHQAFQFAEPVEYVVERPTMNIFTQTIDRQVTASMRTKSKVWDYEREWRVIEANHVGHRTIDRSAIASVVLGARADQSTAQLIRSWAELNDPPIPVHQADLVGDSYAIAIPGMPM